MRAEKGVKESNRNNRQDLKSASIGFMSAPLLGGKQIKFYKELFQKWLPYFKSIYSIYELARVRRGRKQYNKGWKR